MASPGDKLYRIVDVRCIARAGMIQISCDTYIVDNQNKNVPTGTTSVRIPWNQAAFDALKTAIASAVATDPTLAGFTAI